MRSSMLSVRSQLFLQFLCDRDTVKMSRLPLLLFIICLLKIEVKCGTLGKISKTEESLMPRTGESLPSNASRLNLDVSSLNEANASLRNEHIENRTSPRQGKFFPKVAFLAGLNIGGLGSAVPPSLASLAKISESKGNFGSPSINPYIAAMIDPYPYASSSLAVHQSLLSLYYRLLDRIKLQMDSNNVVRNNSSVEQTENTSKAPVTPAEVDTVTIDAGRRRKDKLKAQRAAEKRRKEEKRRREEIEKQEYEEYEDDDDEEVEVTRAPQRKPSRKGISAKQAVPTNNTTTQKTIVTNVTTMGTIETTTVTPVANTTNNGNGMYPFNRGYYGGNPQQIGNIGFTYNTPHDAYGPPANSYGLPANGYGPPASGYGPPSNNYGPPSNNYGPPSNSFISSNYETPPYADGPHPVINGPFVTGSSLYPNSPLQSFLSFVTPQYPPGLLRSQDHESIIFDDPTGNSFPSSDRWPQYPPFARSRKFAATTGSPINDRNGFVPI